MTQTSLHQLKTSVDPRDEFKQLYIDHKKHVFAMALSILRDFELAEDSCLKFFLAVFWVNVSMLCELSGIAKKLPANGRKSPIRRLDSFQ